MVNTGYIAFMSEIAAAMDGDGNQLPSTKELSAYVPCNLARVSREYRTMVDGQYLQAKFTIVIDNFRIAAIDLSGLKEVQLQDSKMHDLGLFQVQDKEFLDLTSRLKIIV